MDKPMFKLWCKDKNEWEKDPWVVLPSGGVMDLQFHMPYSPDNHILCQYKGIDDKDGDPIYAGDILSYRAINYTDCSQTEIESIEDEEFIEIISYHPLASIIKPHSPGVKCFGWDQETGEGEIIDLKSIELKKVANIYEDARWLEDKDEGEDEQDD